jgi:hypothetical protein
MVAGAEPEHAKVHLAFDGGHVWLAHVWLAPRDMLRRCGGISLALSRWC